MGRGGRALLGGKCGRDRDLNEPEVCEQICKDMIMHMLCYVHQHIVVYKES